jgi:hypothetical protein
LQKRLEQQRDDVVGRHQRRRVRPGSPWMPTPTSISAADLEGGRRRLGHRAARERHAHRRGVGVDARAQRLAFVQVGPGLGAAPDHLLDDQRAGHAAPPRRVGGALDRHVIVDQHGRALHLEHVGPANREARAVAA